MRVIGIDTGIKRTGVAVSDALGISIRFVDTFNAPSRSAAVAIILGHIRELEAEAVAIGLPLMPLSGDEGPMARRARGLAEAVAQAADIPVFLVDERDSSAEASRLMVEAEVPKAKRKSLLDAAAAGVIVRRFLDSGGITVSPTSAAPQADVRLDKE